MGYDEIPCDISDELIQTTTEVRITIKELYCMVYVERLSDAKIGERYGLSAKTIRNYRKKCEFETTFKTGRMDLPLNRVRELLKEGNTFGDIAEYFGTTKTSVKAFCIRHGLDSSGENWPISRQTMIEHVIAEFTNVEIARRYYITLEEVERLQNELQVEPFSGDKTYKKYGNRNNGESLNPFWGLTIQDRARVYFNGRIYYDQIRGFELDGEWISATELKDKVLDFEAIYDAVEVIRRSGNTFCKAMLDCHDRA